MARERLFVEPADWMTRGLCWQQADPDAWFCESRVAATAAKGICRECSVQAECLAYALATDQRFGVWGGLTEGERRRLRTARRQPQPAVHHTEHDADQPAEHGADLSGPQGGDAP